MQPSGAPLGSCFTTYTPSIKTDASRIALHDPYFFKVTLASAEDFFVFNRIAIFHFGVADAALAPTFCPPLLVRYATPAFIASYRVRTF